MLARTERLSGARESKDELRNPFQRDRDRVLYTGHFRRLGGITQVTTPSELHSFHNRLTHTLEVAQIARRIAERANHLLPASTELVNPDVCECAAFAHDLGHPPFGHNGEVTLDMLATGELPSDPRLKNLADGYEGNAQSLRILLKLAVRSKDELGLDLTAASLRATIKYPWKRGQNAEKPRKYGVFESEDSEFGRIWEDLPAFKQTLEAQIMDWADDVAYSTHDFYDFALAGLIPVSLLRLVSARELRKLLHKNGPAAQASDDAFGAVSESFKTLPETPLLSTSRLSSPCVGTLKEWVSFMIGRYAGRHLTFTSEGENVSMQKQGTIEDEVSILKALTYHYAIGAPALAVRREGEKRILSTLFTVLSQATWDGSGLLSEEARASIDQGTHPTRVVLDVLSSMTDAQAVSMYHKLTGISPISILDLTTPSAF